MQKLLPLLLFLLALGHLGINFVGLPPLLVLENIVLAATYAALGVALILRRSKTTLGITALVASFNAGRVSMTIWSPTTGVGGLAAEHAPLLLYLIIVAVLAVYSLLREK
ncbi:hypothetical protein [Pyrobaculum aerophilum]|uniref:hypothetical protein n=1 Tax=Pyrobaculum aerophilum TaxID=13773 RepID=UPI002FD8DE23